MSRGDARRVLVAYDVPDDRRRSRISKALGEYGDRVQYSVFIIDASPARLARVRRALLALMVAEEDSVLFCDLGLTTSLTPDRFGYLGRQREITSGNSLIV